MWFSKRHNLKPGTLANAILLIFLSPVAMGDQIKEYTGEARNGDKLAYTEKHLVRYDDHGKVQEAETKYYNPGGEIIAILKSDFKKSLTVPDHTITNIKNGNVQGLRNQNDKIVMFNQNSNSLEETKELTAGAEEDRIAFGCQGLNYFLVNNLESFEKKKNLPIRFLIPGDLTYYNFELVYIRESENNIVELEIEIDNWLLKLFAPKLQVKYDKIKKRIVWYKGLSNIKDENGKTQSVTITYKYDSI